MSTLVTTILQLAMSILVAVQGNPAITAAQQQQAIGLATQAMQFATEVLQANPSSPAATMSVPSIPKTSDVSQNPMQTALPMVTYPVPQQSVTSPTPVPSVSTQTANDILSREVYLVSMTNRVIASEVDTSGTTPPIQGEGVFAKLSDGQTILLYQTTSDDARDMTNITGQMSASQKGGGAFRVPAVAAKNVYIEDKYAFFQRLTGNAGNANHAPSPDEMKQLISEVRKVNTPQSVLPVYYKSLVFDSSAMKFSAADIVNIGSVMQTTGGSVFVLPVSFKSGSSLNIIRDARKANAEADLQKLGQDIVALGRTGGVITAKDPAYQDIFYTFSGTLSGWTVWNDNVSLIQSTSL